MNTPEKKKFRMTLSLNVLNHLGMNLYSNISAVLSEVVANSYDADATDVNIQIESEKITISDNGHGMNLTDINDKFLHVGYERRKNNEAFSYKLRRPVMGRKGIGKLSLFSIANQIEVYTAIKKNRGQIEKNGFLLKKADIIEQIKGDKNGVYYPKEISTKKEKLTLGTKLVISDFKKNISHTENFLRRRLAKRFSVIGDNFNVKINGKSITLKDRDFFGKIQFIWFIGKENKSLTKQFDFKQISIVNGVIDNGKGYEIKGWIGAVNEAGDLDSDGVNNNKISILCRGKMAQEDVLESYNEGGIYSKYLIGEIEADFLDLDEEEDISTSSRQKINEEDPRYIDLLTHVYKILKEVQNKWTQLRRKVAEDEAIERAEKFNPVLKKWFDGLNSESSKGHAKKLFATIETMHFDRIDSVEKKRELYKQGILAFEKLKLRENLEALSKISNPDELKLSLIFNDLSDIEANLYYDIASERVSVIKEFQKKLDVNDKEKLLQQYLFDNLWLLNPSWERATEGSPIMEKRVESELKKVVSSLSPDEKKGRIDIKYRTAAGKHIVVELKRYKPTYKVDQFTLGKQAMKYRDALQKCLDTTTQANDAVEILIVLGEKLGKTPKKEQEISEALKPYNARIIYYDFLIEESLSSYSAYLTKQKEISKLRSIIDQL